MPENRVQLKNSKHVESPNERSLGPALPYEPVRVSIYVRPNPQSDLAKDVKERVIDQKAPMTREEYQKAYGADPKDMERVKKYYQQQGFTLVEENQAQRRLVFRGDVEKANQTFKTTLQRYELDHPERGKLSHLGNPDDISIPKDLQGIITGVFGLDQHPIAHTRIRRPRAMPKTIYTPLDLAQNYNFPNNADGNGQTIAIIELGGGYYPADLETYFSELGISPMPMVNNVSVDGGTNMPGISPDDGEVELDIEVAAAVAPRANIIVYFAPNTSAGFLDAITTAIQDSVNNPSVLSISWGGPEDPSIEPWMLQMDQAFQAAVILGITTCVAAGDQGSSDGLPGENVDFPASSPYVLACGGTSLNGGESVWDDSPTTSATGGGVSKIFTPAPNWQQGLSALTTSNTAVSLTGRGLPDIAGDADPNTGYWVCVDGQFVVEGGTSAVAPLWAGLVALLNQSLGTNVGYLNPVIYTMIDQNQAFNDITQGNNGEYQATPGWDACSGWGSPDGVQLYNQLSGLATQAQKAPSRGEFEQRAKALEERFMSRVSELVTQAQKAPLQDNVEQRAKPIEEDFVNQLNELIVQSTKM